MIQTKIGSIKAQFVKVLSIIPTRYGIEKILLSLTDDQDFEDEESFTLLLSNPTGGATLGTSQMTVTIADNDAARSASAAATTGYTTICRYYLGFGVQAPAKYQ